MSDSDRTDLRAFFEPKSIAAIGSLREMFGTAFWLVKNLQDMGYGGKLYPINPRTSEYAEMLGLPVHASVEAVPGTIDLAVVLAPPATTPDVIDQCVRKGVKAVIVLSEGFAESGEEGAKLQQQLTGIARQTGIRIIGPNTFGVVNAANKLATIAPYLDQSNVQPGGIAVISQTGSTGPHQMPVVDWAYPISKMCDLGNKCDVDEADMLYYLADDPETKVVAMHLEDVRDGPRFMDAARKVVERKPLVILKTGRTEAGARASASHTGSMLGSDRVYDAALRQVGAIRVDTWQELWEVPKTLLLQPLPRGNRFAVITITGGQGVIAADAAARAGLEVAKFLPDTERKLSDISPRLGGNPVDLGPAMSDSRSQSGSHPFAALEAATKLVLDDPGVDCATITFCVGRQLVPMFPKAVEIVDGMTRGSGKPVNMWIYGTSLSAMEEASRQLQARGLPACFDLDVAIRALGCSAGYSATVSGGDRGHRPRVQGRSQAVTNIIEHALRENRSLLSEVESKQLVAAAGIPVVESQLASTKAQAVALSREIGFPVVLKIASPDIIHKSDCGGVRVGLRNAAQVARAYSDIMTSVRTSNPKARIDGVAVQRMVERGTEVIMGMSTDPQFGPVLMFGLGGVFVEVLKDVSFRVAPLSQRDAAQMVRAIKGFPVLEGHRGGEPANLAAIEEMLLELSDLAASIPEIREVDLNPVLVDATGAIAVDARVILDRRP